MEKIIRFLSGFRKRAFECLHHWWKYHSERRQAMIKHRERLAHEFVEYIPADIKEGKIYISLPYATATHKCRCGCGKEVITPLSPTDWKLIYDGQSVSLDPSIGNWSFDCKSHYWIKHSQVIWSYRWSPEQIQSNREYDRSGKEQYYGKGKTSLPLLANQEVSQANENSSNFVAKLIGWLSK